MAANCGLCFSGEEAALANNESLGETVTRLSRDEIKAACEAFFLTDAVRPAPGTAFVPQSGYRLGRFLDKETGQSIPMLVVSVPQDRLLEVFTDLIGCLDGLLDVILETSHDSEDGRHKDLWRESIDLPVLLSHLWDYEDLLLEDGCTGMAVLESLSGVEVQLDEHKLLFVYGDDLEPFLGVLKKHGIPRNDRMKLICEVEHLHSTTDDYKQRFEEMCCRFGVASDAPALNS